MEAIAQGLAEPRTRTKWRYRSDAARVVIVFTDASFKETMSIPEAKGGSLQDVANVVMANRIILSLFAPNFEGYDRLSQIDKSEWEVVEYEGLNAAGGAAEVHVRPGQLPHHAEAARRERVALGRDRGALSARARASARHGQEAQGRRHASAATASPRCSGPGMMAISYARAGAATGGRSSSSSTSRRRRRSSGTRPSSPTRRSSSARVRERQGRALRRAPGRRVRGALGRAAATSRRTSSSRTAPTCSRCSTRSASSTGATEGRARARPGGLGAPRDLGEGAHGRRSRRCTSRRSCTPT